MSHSLILVENAKFPHQFGKDETTFYRSIQTSFSSSTKRLSK